MLSAVGAVVLLPPQPRMVPKAIKPATTIIPPIMPKVRFPLFVEVAPLSLVVAPPVVEVGLGVGFGVGLGVGSEVELDVGFGAGLDVGFGVGVATASVSFSRLNVRFTCFSRLNERVLLRLLLSSFMV